MSRVNKLIQKSNQVLRTKDNCGNSIKINSSCLYPNNNRCGNEQYLYFKDGNKIKKTKIYPSNDELFNCCFNRKGNCGLAIPKSDICHDYLKDYCLDNFDDNCRRVCSSSNPPNWCYDVGKDYCKSNPKSEVCTYFCSKKKFDFCPVDDSNYIPKEYSWILYIACIIIILLLFIWLF